MERPKLTLVPEQYETPIVREVPPRPPKGFNLRLLQSIQTLPDNVFVLRPEQSGPPDAA